MVGDDHTLPFFPKNQVRTLARPLFPTFAPQASDRLDRPHSVHIYTQ